MSARGQGGGEVGSPTFTQPSTLRQAPSSPSARWTRTRRAFLASAPHTPANRLRVRRRRRGRWRGPASGLLECSSRKAKARAWSLSACQIPAPSLLHFVS